MSPTPAGAAAREPRSSQPGAYRRDIDGLRAVAVLAVVAYHVNEHVLPGGFVGVDVFFVISGYLITGGILSSSQAPAELIADFYRRRVRRIFPALIVVLAACLAWGWFWLLPDEYEALGTHVAAAAVFLSNAVLAGEAGYFTPTPDVRPLLHLWSLAIEEQFYLAWPVLMVLCRRWGWRPAGFIAAVAACSWVAGVLLVDRHPIGVFYNPGTRAWELAAGAWMAARERRPAATNLVRIPPWMAFCVATGMLGYSMVSMAAVDGWPGWGAWLPVGATLLLLGPARNSVVGNAVLGNRVMVGVGLVSYPFYLWHWPLLALWQSAGADRPAVERYGVAAVSALLAWATYAGVEKPVRHGVRRAGGTWRVPVGTLVACLAVLGVGGLGVRAARGFESRLPTSMAELARWHHVAETDWRPRTCFLVEGQGPGDFGDSCVDPDDGTGRPVVMVWGDSHAAHLVSGLRAALGERGPRLAQYTAWRCPAATEPVKGAPPGCSDINGYVDGVMHRMVPRVLVLAARWQVYPGLDPTAVIARARAAGVQRVIVVGPGPEWPRIVPRQVLDLLRRDPRHVFPRRITRDPEDGADELDRTVERAAVRAGAEYFSPVRTLCDAGTCVVATGDQIDTILFQDRSHFTTHGSLHVARMLVPMMRPALETGEAR